MRGLADGDQLLMLAHAFEAMGMNRVWIHGTAVDSVTRPEWTDVKRQLMGRRAARG
ncbi:hypothetical protein [Streptomyces sp. A0592]|uniref:hypothetical protein n=1 Tax=Streptomyces sp. A0592 TaxID=2563099 RepID=UPI001446BBAE|nr:hypothetical protein [Streptomyces sp. A0592]